MSLPTQHSVRSSGVTLVGVLAVLGIPQSLKLRKYLEASGKVLILQSRLRPERKVDGVNSKKVLHCPGLAIEEMQLCIPDISCYDSQGLGHAQCGR